MSLSDDDPGEVQFCRGIQNVRRRAQVLAIDSDEENTPPAAVGKLHSTFAPAQGLFTVRNGPCTLSFVVHQPSQRGPINAAGQGHSVNCNHHDNNSPCCPLTQPAASAKELCSPCSSAADSPSSCDGDGAEATTSPSLDSCSKHAPVAAQEAASLPGTPCTIGLQVTSTGAAADAACLCTPNMPSTPTAAALDIDDPFTPWLRTARKQGRSTAPGSSSSRQQTECELSSPMSISSSSSMASWQQGSALDDMLSAALSPTDLAPAAVVQTQVKAAAASGGSAKDDLAASAAAPATDWQAAVGWASAATAAITTRNQQSPVQALLQPVEQSTGSTLDCAGDLCVDGGPVWTPEGATGAVNLLTQLSAAVSLMCSSIDSPPAAQAVTPVPFHSQFEPLNASSPQAMAATKQRAAGATATPASGSIEAAQRCASGNLGKQPDQQAAQDPASFAAAYGDVAAATRTGCSAATAAADGEASAVQHTELHETADLTAITAAAGGNLYSSDSDDEDMQLTYMRRRPSKEATKATPQQPADEYVAAAAASEYVTAAGTVSREASAADLPVLHTLADLTAKRAAAVGNLYSSDSDEEEDMQLTIMFRRPSRNAKMPISQQSASDSDSSGIANSSHPSCSGRNSTGGMVEPQPQAIATANRGFLAHAHRQPVTPSAGQPIRGSVNRASIGTLQTQVATVDEAVDTAEPSPAVLQLPVQGTGGSKGHSTSSSSTSSDDDEDDMPLTVVRRRVPVAGEAVTEGQPEAVAPTEQHTNCSGTLAAKDDKHWTVLEAEAVCPVDVSTHEGHSIRGGGGSSDGSGSTDSRDGSSEGDYMQLIPQPNQYTRRGAQQLVPLHEHQVSSKGNSSSTHCRGSSSSDDDDQPVIFSRRQTSTPAGRTAATRDPGHSSRSSSSHNSSKGGDSNWSSGNSDGSADTSSDFSFSISTRKTHNQRHGSSISQQATQQITAAHVTPQACPGRITSGSSSSLVARRRKRRGANEHGTPEAALKSQQQQQQKSPWWQQGEVDIKAASSTPPPAPAAGCDPYDFEAVMATLTPPNTISACVKTPGMPLAYNSSCGLTPCADLLPFTPAAAAAAAPWTCAHPSDAAAGPAATTAAPTGACRLSFGLSPVSTPMLKPQVLFGAAAAATGIAGRSVLTPSSLINSSSITPAAPAGRFNTPVGPAGGKGTGRKRQQQPVVAATAPAKAPTSKVFARQRQQLAQQLYDQWNAQVFDGGLPAQLPLVWNTRLTSTAGQVVDDGSQNTRKASRDERIPVRLELSTKVLDTEVRLRTTLGHEMCHVAAWAISKEFKQHHGPAFWMWAKRFEDRIAGIKITTCHNYEIHAPFRWQCMNTECGKQYHRHKRSIDPNKHVCSRCNGRLMFLGKFSRDGKVLSVTRPGAATPGAASKTPGGGGNVFSQFVKTHFASVKKEMPAGTPHKELMSRLASQYKQHKTTAKTPQPQQQQIEKQQDSQQHREQHPRKQQQQGISERLVDEAVQVDSSSVGGQLEIIELVSDSDSASDTEQQQQQQPPPSQRLDVAEANLLSFMKRLDLAG